MLKRNLFFIIVIGLAFVFTTNAFGQDNKRKIRKAKSSQTTSNRSKPKSKPSDTQQNVFDAFLYLDIPTTRRKPKSKQRTANTSGNVNKPLKNNVPRQGGGTRGKGKN